MPLYAASYTGSTDFVFLTVRYGNNSQGDQNGVLRHYVCGGPKIFVDFGPPQSHTQGTSFWSH